MLKVYTRSLATHFQEVVWLNATGDYTDYTAIRSKRSLWAFCFFLSSSKTCRYCRGVQKWCIENRPQDILTYCIVGIIGAVASRATWYTWYLLVLQHIRQHRLLKIPGEMADGCRLMYGNGVVVAAICKASSFWDLLTYLSEWINLQTIWVVSVSPALFEGSSQFRILQKIVRTAAKAFSGIHEISPTWTWHTPSWRSNVTCLSRIHDPKRPYDPIYPPTKGQSYWSTVPSNRIHGNSSMGNVHWNLRLPPGLLEDLERLVERRERAMETQQAVLLMCGLKLR